MNTSTSRTDRKKYFSFMTSPQILAAFQASRAKVTELMIHILIFSHRRAIVSGMHHASLPRNVGDVCARSMAVTGATRLSRAVAEVSARTARGRLQNAAYWDGKTCSVEFLIVC